MAGVADTGLTTADARRRLDPALRPGLFCGHDVSPCGDDTREAYNSCGLTMVIRSQSVEPLSTMQRIDTLFAG